MKLGKLGGYNIVAITDAQAKCLAEMATNGAVEYYEKHRTKPLTRKTIKRSLQIVRDLIKG